MLSSHFSEKGHVTEAKYHTTKLSIALKNPNIISSPLCFAVKFDHFH